MRDNFTKMVIQSLRLEVAGYCSRPECRKMTIVPDIHTSGNNSTTGFAAHITAASPGGPRYDSSLTNEQRRAADNGIWLCCDCATLIDRNQGKDFSVELLKTWKQCAKQYTYDAAMLPQATDKPYWLDKIRSIDFINIPRLNATYRSFKLSKRTELLIENGFPKDRFIADALAEIENSVKNLSIKSIDIKQIIRPDAQLTEGFIVSFYQQCRTKNSSSTEQKFINHYSYDNSPLIYCKSNNYKYIFPYDPKWLTTSTALSNACSGSIKLSGAGIIKKVDHANKQAICTPLVFGIPNFLDFILPN